jgi:hypothetical protein
VTRLQAVCSPPPPLRSFAATGPRLCALRCSWLAGILTALPAPLVTAFRWPAPSRSHARTLPPGRLVLARPCAACALWVHGLLCGAVSVWLLRHTKPLCGVTGASTPHLTHAACLLITCIPPLCIPSTHIPPYTTDKYHLRVHALGPPQSYRVPPPPRFLPAPRVCVCVCGGGCLRCSQPVHDLDPGNDECHRHRQGSAGEVPHRRTSNLSCWRFYAVWGAPLRLPRACPLRRGYAMKDLASSELAPGCVTFCVWGVRCVLMRTVERVLSICVRCLSRVGCAFLRPAHLQCKKENITFAAGASFLVSRERILANSREFYQNILKALDSVRQPPRAAVGCMRMCVGGWLVRTRWAVHACRRLRRSALGLLLTVEGRGNAATPSPLLPQPEPRPTTEPVPTHNCAPPPLPGIVAGALHTPTHTLCNCLCFGIFLFTCISRTN